MRTFKKKVFLQMVVFSPYSIVGCQLIAWSSTVMHFKKLNEIIVNEVD